MSRPKITIVEKTDKTCEYIIDKVRKLKVGKGKYYYIPIPRSIAEGLDIENAKEIRVRITILK